MKRKIEETTKPADDDVVEEPSKSQADLSLYYSMIKNQQNMLEDYTRTGGYYNAIMKNAADFKGKVVMDVGAGSGILSIFAAQAGAKKVYAVEASNMAHFTKKLVDGNGLSDVIEVLHKRLEDVELEEKVDIIISEPIGVLLVHERMIETYVKARDLFLKKGGLMFPGTSNIFVCPFSDPTLALEQQHKAAFWDNHNFYGVDVSVLREDAVNEHVSQPVVGMFDPSFLIAKEYTKYPVDFRTITLEELYKIKIPFQTTVSETAICHGLATWFDFTFAGSDATVVIDTAPFAPVTHWQQCRFLLEEPLAVNATQKVSGVLDMSVNNFLSYDVKLDMRLDGTGISGQSQHLLQNQLYYYVPQAQKS